MTPKPHESSSYAPIRLRELPYWSYARTAANKGGITAQGLIAPDLYPHFESSVIAPTLQLAERAIQSGELPEGAAGGLYAKVMLQYDWIPLIGQYELCGRQIFDFHERLSELLDQTDLSQCTIEDLHLPYEAFFIRFGKLANCRRPFGCDDQGNTTEWEYLDGALIARTPADDGRMRLKIGFSTVHEDGSGVMQPGYFFDLQPDEMALSVPEAIEAALARRLESLGPKPGDTAQQEMLAKFRQFEVEEAAHLIRDGASMLVNALFYLESIRAEMPALIPGRDTPPSMVSRWSSSPPAKKNKVRASLTADGYALVRLVGQEIERAEHTAAAGGGGVRLHWRRGHWRFQRFGEGNAQRRRIWIKPVLVGREQAGASEPRGHIYVPAPPDTLQ